MNQSISAYRFRRFAAFALLAAALCGRAGSQEPASATTGPASPPVGLETLVSEVLENNPELNFYKAEIAASKGGRRQAGLYENPEFSADAGRKRARGTGLSAEGAAWSVSVLQTFEYPGRIALRKAIANQNIRLAELGYGQFKAALQARARELGYNLLISQQKAEAARDVADRLRQLLELLVQREPAGITPLIEIRIIEASVVTFRKQSIEAAQVLQSALFEVNLLRGEPLDTRLQIATPELAFPSPPELKTFLASARQNNFDIQMRLVELEQQGFKLSLSKNQRWPKISIGPFVSQENAGERETVAGIGISLPLPLWNRNAGNIDLEKARTEQAETSLFLAQLKVEQEVMEHYLAYKMKAAETERWRTNSIQRFHEAAELADRHYRLGSLPIATYIEVQREYLDALNSILSLQLEALASQQQLEVLTGLKMNSATSRLLEDQE